MKKEILIAFFSWGNFWQRIIDYHLVELLEKLLHWNIPGDNIIKGGRTKHRNESAEMTIYPRVKIRKLYFKTNTT